MTRLGLSVTNDLDGLTKRFGEYRLKQIQKSLALQVGTDSNKFCKEDTGLTKSTMRTSSNFEAGEVSWTTPYANEAYYDPRVRSVKNPNATSRWFETAKSQRMDSWINKVERMLNGGD